MPVKQPSPVIKNPKKPVPLKAPPEKQGAPRVEPGDKPGVDPRDDLPRQ